jgi:hypothetical protein
VQTRERFGRGSGGRLLRQEQAQRILIAALGVLTKSTA